MIYRGYWLFWGEYQIYAIEVLKISVISRVRSTSEIAVTFNIWDEIFLVFAEKKEIFFLFFFRKGKNLTFFLVISFLDNLAWFNAFSGFNIGFKRSLHLENRL